MKITAVLKMQTVYLKTMSLLTRNSLPVGNSGAGNDNNHAHPDTSMKLGRNVHYYLLLEFFSLANQNWSIFKMAALKSKMAATINVKS